MDFGEQLYLSNIQKGLRQSLECRNRGEKVGHPSSSGNICTFTDQQESFG